VAVAGCDADGVSDTDDLDGTGSIRLCAVAELAPAVRSPALHAARRRQRTRVKPAHCDGNDVTDIDIDGS
jgi:hypothetical protein